LDFQNAGISSVSKILSVVILAFWLFNNPTEDAYSITLVSMLVVAVSYLGYKIFPYTALSGREMVNCKAVDPANSIRIFSGNVLESNTNYPGFLALIKNADPDIVLLLETDENWQQGLAELEKIYPYTLYKAIHNTYGLLFYSKLKLSDSSVNFLVESDVPSISTLIELPSKQLVQIWGLHPKPPLPTENIKATAKNKELMLVAFKARECMLPVIVMGDLNDVAWSYITELFRKTSKLLDPRRGRGFFSTFSAKSFLIRFPLDYIFASTHFTLISMKRLPATGSDHFPILTELQFSPASVVIQEEPEADKEELQEAAEIAQEKV
jgi:endonuclease/exonuclease/phosphatase (EEP) superfamily protein YafD